VTETEQTTTRDIDVVHEFTDFEEFAKAVEGAVLLKLNFDIATEIRKENHAKDLGFKMLKVDDILVRYWMVIVH